MNPEAHSFRRKDIRIPEFDYSQPGAFFVTIVTKDRKTLFGQVNNGKMVLNNVGKLAEEVWLALATHFPNVELGECVIMPNHVHGIISINVEATHASPLPRISKGPAPGSIGAIIGSFKSAVTKRVHQISKNTNNNLWQRNYYEHIIRNDRDYQAIYEYIHANPLNWEKDEEYLKL